MVRIFKKIREKLLEDIYHASFLVFHYALPICHEQMPELREFDNGHKVACHLLNDKNTLDD